MKTNLPFFFDTFTRYKDTDRVVAEFGDELYTYREMWRDMNAVARYVAQWEDRTPVIVWGDKENRILPCIYGAIAGGHPYVFIPSYYPQNRVVDIVGDCGANLVLNPSAVPFPAIDGTTVCEGEAFAALLAGYDGTPLDTDRALTNDDVWVIIYTSGSTGKPKGVVITGRSIMVRRERFRPDFDRYYTCQGDKPTRALNITSYAFSISIDPVFFSVGAHAATLCSVPITILRNFPLFFETLLKIDPDYFSITPSMFELMLKDERFCEANMPSLRGCTGGGEPFNTQTARLFKERFPHADLRNVWGSTETCAGPLGVLADDALLEREGVLPIGYETDRSVCDAVDADGNSLPDGEVGEMVIAGGFVSDGYLNLPEKNAERFFTNAAGARAYRTGDLICFKGNYVYYKGRMDNMVKVGGYRVELEDVENNLRTVDIVATCAVAPVYSGDSVLMLAAYVVLKPAAQSMSKIAAVKQIKAALSGKVQEYMLPQKISIVDDLPKNTSGKLDRVKLKEMSRLQ